MTDPLVSVYEVATMLGVSRQGVDDLSRTPGFPAPDATPASGRIWRLVDIERWADATGRR